MNYYFLAAALPELQFGYPPEMEFHELEVLLKNNLSESDYEKVEVMRRYYDIQNIRAFWKEEELDPRGNFNENELEEALLTRTGFPDYVYEFLETYEGIEARLHNFAALVEAYFREEIETWMGFLETILSFEREWRLVLCGFRAKKLGRDLNVELQYEDPDDEIVAQILAQKDAHTYEPPSRYEELKGLFEEHETDPLALHKALCEYRFQKLESAFGVQVFSIDRILAYIAQLITLEKWLELDRKEGMKIVDTIVKEAS